MYLKMGWGGAVYIQWGWVVEWLFFWCFYDARHFQDFTFSKLLKFVEVFQIWNTQRRSGGMCSCNKNYQESLTTHRWFLGYPEIYNQAKSTKVMSCHDWKLEVKNKQFPTKRDTPRAFGRHYSRIVTCNQNEPANHLRPQHSIWTKISLWIFVSVISGCMLLHMHWVVWRVLWTSSIPRKRVIPPPESAVVRRTLKDS